MKVHQPGPLAWLPASPAWLAHGAGPPTGTGAGAAGTTAAAED